ncbi:MAG: hypothetical protein AB1609_14700 [Bacillota bacterium]
MPVLPAPDPIGIPAPPALLQFLLVLTYTLHTLFVGVVVGGTALGLVHTLAVRRGETALWPLGAHLSQALPVAMAFAITTGVAPLLFVQVLFGQFFYTSSVFVGWTWISVIAALIAGYYALYYWAIRRRERAHPPGWGLAVALLALAWVAFVMVTNMSLYARPERFAELFNLAGTALNTSEPTFAPRYVHALLNFLVIGASYALTAGHLLGRRLPDGGRRIRGFALRWLAGSLAIQAAASAWYYVSLPVALRQGTLQVAGMVIALILGAVMLAVWVLAQHAARPGAWAASGAAATVAMAAGLAVARHGVRMASLSAYLQPEAWKLSPQWPQFVLFAALLLGGLVLVGYLLWRYPWQQGLRELQADAGAPGPDPIVTSRH